MWHNNLSYAERLIWNWKWDGEDVIKGWIKRGGEGLRGPWKLNSCLWICIFIFGPWSVWKTMGTPKFAGPSECIQPSPIQRHKFSAEALSEMAWREAQAPLRVPESNRQEVVLQELPSPRRFPWIPTIPLVRWLVTYSAMRHRAPLDRSHKGTRGGSKSEMERDGRRKKKTYFIHRHNMTQITVDCPFLVGTKLPLCPKLQERKGNKKPNEKGVLQRLIRYKQDQSIPSLRNRGKSISFLFPSFLFYVWP